MDRNFMLLTAISVVFVLIIVIILFIQRIRLKSVREKMNRFERLLTGIEPSSSLEENMNRLLELIAELVPAMTYSFYIYDRKNGRFLLRSVRACGDSDAKVGPSYSGLVPYQKDGYHPPIHLEQDTQSDGTGVVHHGDAELINIALGGRGVIRIGPVKQLPKKKLKEVVEFADYLLAQTALLVDSDYFKEQTDVLKFSEEAIQYIMRVTMDPMAMIHNVFESSFHAFNLNGGYFALQEKSQFEIVFKHGLSAVDSTHFVMENDVQHYLEQLKKDEPFTIVTKESSTFANLPKWMKEKDQNVYLFYRYSIQNRVGYMSFWFSENGRGKKEVLEQVESIKVMLQKLGIYLKYQDGTHQLKQVQIEKLKMLAQIVDNKSPYTVGYSDMMSRYAIIIAKEIGLDEQTIVNVGLAAYLSNLGVIGLSDAFLFKEGKYSDVEYEQMKLHAEVGAAIIDSTIGNSTVSAYIKYHHERMDGNGYPEGLSGEEIPIGSRIISVVQTFLAKINGRSYRDPVDFDEALEMLEKSKGTQLDEGIVDTFINWFQRKRQNPLVVGKSLGKCWEMCCVPASICLNCPAYGHHEKNCWEYETNNCKAHGKACETCFVYTEAKERLAGKYKLRSGEKSIDLYEPQKR